MKTKIENLREHLFATLEGLLDEEKPMALDRAETIAKVSQVIINSAKAETDRIKVLSEMPEIIPAGDFIPAERRLEKPIPR